MNLRDLEYLVALHEQRHFGRAAAASFVSQPTLSTQIRKLEGELGVALIERSSRSVIFTAVGEAVVLRARRILAEAEEIRGLARQARKPHAGTIRLGMFPTLGPYLLPHVVPELRSRFPGLEILLVEEKTAVLLDELRSGALDAAAVALPIVDETLHIEPLFREEFVLAAPLGDPVATGEGPLDPSAIAGENLLLLTEGHCLRDQALALCAETGATEHAGFRATSLETLRHMVAAGVGATLMPELAVAPPVTPNPAIVLRRFTEPSPHRDIALLWRRTSVYRELLPEVAEVLRGIPGHLVEPLPAAA
ncbi:LysR family transcriptional regulator, hydrogen peroxide-inducible genes activator [Raineyella antarctica]|uniref:Probable hydrogen peroxide-inducible genes activator n=1 Tax=Raineyella antarctica TaxID=1577474 RepID=A0A1G6H6D2_9ACTN|nr:LysR substrate-binding domain-containing protein [Raineyella antarctica]SDB89829.1 LysR family transcriptional regulator, hydrogen peroxide-inducible genes activator [Raineyella antarctica]